MSSITAVPFMALLNNSLSLILLYALSCSVANAEIIKIGQFSNGDLSGWEKHEFEGITQYKLVKLKDVTVLQANSKQSASGLVKKISINLDKTPYLNWRWQVKEPLYRMAENLKQGDDFAARIYVVIDGGVLFWRTLALNYVWASQKTVNSVWDNPFTSNAQMIAVQSGDKHAGQWLSEKRNVKEDLRKVFGREFQFIDAVAIMTDTDNSKQQATAYYGDIFFTSD